ncbi:MAG TPA: hypothetical protein VG963_01100, partial [Polyangiaceae bacterium]|nr:hypothetical protein [Polyangiaceae bacterium]
MTKDYPLRSSPSVQTPILRALHVEDEARPPEAVHALPWLAFAQLGTFTSLLYLFRIESENLSRVFLVGLGGFAASAIAAPARRHWIFLATSAVAGAV